MTYSEAREIYNLDHVLDEIESLEKDSVIDFVHQEIYKAEQIKIPNKVSHRSRKELVRIRYEYLSNLKGIVFGLQQSIEPTGVNEDVIHFLKKKRFN